MLLQVQHKCAGEFTLAVLLMRPTNSRHLWKEAAVGILERKHVDEEGRPASSHLDVHMPRRIHSKTFNGVFLTFMHVD